MIDAELMPAGMSALERDFWVDFTLYAPSDLDAPVFDQVQPVAGRDWRVDFAWPKYKFLVEVEGGLNAYARGRHIRKEGYHKDCLKYNACQAAGWFVYRVTEISLQDPEKLIEDVVKVMRMRIQNNG